MLRKGVIKSRWRRVGARGLQPGICQSCRPRAPTRRLSALETLHPLLNTPQQPVKVVALVGASPTRRIGRFTTERLGACRPRKGTRGVSSPSIEPMGLNEDEPQLMSLDIKLNRSRRVTGVMMKADVCVADNRQPAQSPAGSAWQARREGQPQIKRGGWSR